MPASARPAITTSPAASSPCTAATRFSVPATPVWLAAVESAINRGIDGSIKASAAAAQLNRTSLRIEVEGLLSIRAAIHANRLVLAAGGASADAIISGPPLSFLRLLAIGTAGAPVGPAQERGAVRITGDAEIAARYRELFALARPDFQEEASRLVGDVPARRLSLLAGS